MTSIKYLPVIMALVAPSCATTRAPSLNLLEKVADYDGSNQVNESLEAVDNPLLMPIRTQPMIADIWVHPHELENGDYFRGGWIRTVVSRSQWQIEGKHEPLLPVPAKRIENKVRGKK